MNNSLTKAWNLVQQAHHGQTYEGKSYVIGHLLPVYELVRKYCSIHDVQVSAILHDVVEDTTVSLDTIKKEFGQTVANLVWRLTDESGLTRLEKKLKTYPKIRQDKYAILIKLADRLINTKSGKKLDMYQKEYPVFRSQLYIPGMWDELWKELDSLSIKKAA